MTELAELARQPIAGRRAKGATLELRGEITAATEEAFAAELARLAAAGSPRLSLYINSAGGSVSAGIGIFSALRRYPGGVDTWTDGLAASMAGVVFLAGERRLIARGSWLMVHSPWMDMAGNSEALRRGAGMLDRFGQTMAAIIAERSGQAEDLVAQWLAAETWFGADDALAAGLATEIQGVAASAALAAVPLGAFRSLPAALVRPHQAAPAASAQETGVTAETVQAAAETAPAAPPTPAEVRAATAERGRIAEINRICAAARLGDEGPTLAERLIGEGVALDKARGQVFDAMAARQMREQPGPQGSVIRVGGGYDHGSPAALMTRMQGALVHRLVGGELAEESREYRGASIVEMAKALGEARGLNLRWARPAEVIRAVLTTSDLPTLLQDTGNRALGALFERQRTELVKVCAPRYVPDFRPIKSARRSETDKLRKVGEGGEVTYGALSDKAETYSVATYALNYAFTREAMVNDDLGALDNFLSDMANSSATTEADLIVAALTGSANLSDGNPLFHASHKNLLASGAALSVASVAAGRAALRTMPSMRTGEPLNLRSRYLVVPAALEADGQVVLTSEYGTSPTHQANPVKGTAELIVDARLDAISAAAWYLFADPALMPVLEIAYLDGTRSMSTNGQPVTEVFTSPDVLGTTFRAYYDVGCGVADWHGAWKNPGP